MNVLLADDSVPAQNMGKKILMDAGYGVVTVSNGLEALRKIAETVPDIAILDIFMPGYTGLEICKRLRSSAATSAVPVILTVGKLEPYRPEDGEQVQSNAVIVKPFAAAELISAVRSLIGGPLAESEAQPRGEVHPAAGGEESPLEAPEPDEPLFASRSAEVAGYGSGSPLASSGYGSDSPLSGADSNPANLAFDPDARHTPFSASAIDFLPPASYPVAGDLASAFTEFDLAPEPSSYPAYDAPALADEPSLPAPAEPLITHEAAQEVTQAVKQQVLNHEAAPEEPAAFPGFDAAVAAPEPITYSALVPEGLESAALSIPAFDPLPELPEASAQAGAESGAAQHFPEELSPEEVARREAFEALFNSTEPPPVDHVFAPPAETDPLSGISELPEDRVYRLEPEPENDRQQDFASGLDLNPLEEAQPEYTRPEYAKAEDTRPEYAPPEEAKPEEAKLEDAWLASALSEAVHALALSPALAPVHEVPALPEAPALEVPPTAFNEAHPETPGAYEVAPQPELAPAAPEFAPAAWRSHSEVVPSESVPSEVPSEVVPSEIVAAEAVVPEIAATAAQRFVPELLHSPEPLHSEAETPVAEAAPAHLEAESAPMRAESFSPLQVEAAPLEMDAAPMQMEAAPAQVEGTLASLPAEAEADAVRLQPEQPIAEISSPPALSAQLHESERIHHAVELVFDRFRPLLVAAIVRELARHD